MTLSKETTVNEQNDQPTTRDLFAASALRALMQPDGNRMPFPLSEPKPREGDEAWDRAKWARSLAETAFLIANAMMAARSPESR